MRRFARIFVLLPNEQCAVIFILLLLIAIAALRRREMNLHVPPARSSAPVQTNSFQPQMPAKDGED